VGSTERPTEIKTLEIKETFQMSETVETVVDTEAEAEVHESRRSLALPTTVADLMAMKKSGKSRTVNDEVDFIHLRVWEGIPEYVSYLDAVGSEQAIEGSLVADDLEAARIIRDYAQEHGIHVVGSLKLHTIRRALLVVLRRYRISRSERRDA